MILFSTFLLMLGGWFYIHSPGYARENDQGSAGKSDLRQQIQSTIDERLANRRNEETADPFDTQGRLRLLLIGLDSRSGNATGHCDAIQFLEIDRTYRQIKITAVPRGTYSPLPEGGHLPGDYYIANACGIGGLQYGLNQIEKILGQPADYVAVIGFSESLGAFRLLGLPTTETLQWLRLRQGYAVGEPQRAHNHSTFIKQLLVKFTPTETSPFDAAWEYLLYNLVKTDLSFQQVRKIAAELAAMDLAGHPERISLSVKPLFAVAEIPYDPQNLDAYLSSQLDPIAALIPEGAYAGVSKDGAQRQLMDLINAGLADDAFVSRAFEQKLWLQVEDGPTRESVHFALLAKRISARTADDEKKIDPSRLRD